MPAYYLEAITVTIGLFLLVAEAFSTNKSKSWVGLCAILGLVAVLFLTTIAIGPEAKPGATWSSWPLWNFYQFDSLARFFKVLSLVCTILVLFLSIDYRSILARFTEGGGTESATGEFYSLPVFACAGMMWMASAKDLAGLFVSLELVTITFYILVAYMRRNVGSLEAGVKYLILGALSTGFLVYGIAWVYGATGTMNLAALPSHIGETPSSYLLFGIALVFIALGFKVGAAPMHYWIPDVYQGAPTPTTAFLSVGSKAAGFIALIRFSTPLLHSSASPQVVTLLALLASATLVVGNLAAIGQKNFKRLLAYSSISNAGFLLLALAANQNGQANALASTSIVSFYLATYLLMTVAAFFVLAAVHVATGSEEISALNGLGKRNPTLALALTVVMASLAGVPLTAGFLGKFFAFQAAVASQIWWGVGLGFVGAAAGFYYYFKPIRAMWWAAPTNPTPIAVPAITRSCVAILVAAILILGVWPQPILCLLGL